MRLITGDCLQVLKDKRFKADLIYLDPPFFTNKDHKLKQRNSSKVFEFSDKWTKQDYINFMRSRLEISHESLKSTGSIFVHCDTNSNYILRQLLNDIFGHFRSEIIWTYKRWSNSARKLLPAHQTILWFSKSKSYKFNRIYTPYADSTNIDQILQRRTRKNGVTVYDQKDGLVVYGTEKNGVPLSDVWEIPYLNPKALERVGYPTQKPVELLRRIIEISTDAWDLIIDPFCGSGTMLVAAKSLDRECVGIDISKDALTLAKNRLKFPYKHVEQKTRRLCDAKYLKCLNGLDVIPVHRNFGIDAFLRNGMVPIRVQREDEFIEDAVKAIEKAKRGQHGILIQTRPGKKIKTTVQIVKTVECVVLDLASQKTSNPV